MTLRVSYLSTYVTVVTVLVTVVTVVTVVTLVTEVTVLTHFLDFPNPWEKLMERSGLRFEYFCRVQKKFDF